MSASEREDGKGEAGLDILATVLISFSICILPDVPDMFTIRLVYPHKSRELLGSWTVLMVLFSIILFLNLLVWEKSVVELNLRLFLLDIPLYLWTVHLASSVIMHLWRLTWKLEECGKITWRFTLQGNAILWPPVREFTPNKRRSKVGAHDCACDLCIIVHKKKMYCIWVSGHVL